MKKCLKLYNDHKQIILYLVFGILTNVINIVAFFIFNNILQVDYKISNVISWFMSVLFAFITNKTIVFRSEDKNKKETIKEIIFFFLARILSLIIDMGLMIILIGIMNLSTLISKIIVNIAVIIINYILSKFLIFKKEG